MYRLDGESKAIREEKAHVSAAIHSTCGEGAAWGGPGGGGGGGGGLGGGGDFAKGIPRVAFVPN